jgi:hypothetical protein
VALAPCVPIIASLRHHVWDLHVVHEVTWALQNRPDKSGRQVPRDVAVKGPDSRVVLVPLQDDVRFCLELSNVTSGRVRRVGHFAVPAGAVGRDGLTGDAMSYGSACVISRKVSTLTCLEATVGSFVWRGRVTLSRPAGTAGDVSEDSAVVCVGPFSDDLDVMT